MAILPPYFETAPVRFEWFPTTWQCFIYRNWEMLTAATIARVLGTDLETVFIKLIDRADKGGEVSARARRRAAKNV